MIIRTIAIPFVISICKSRDAINKFYENLYLGSYSSCKNTNFLQKTAYVSFIFFTFAHK